MKYFVITIKKDTKFASIPIKYFDEIFNNNKNWINVKKHTNENISFLYNVDVKYFFTIETDISNLFKPTHLLWITNKSNLFHTMKRFLPNVYKKYMVFHTDIDMNNLSKYEKLFDGKKIYIIRPSWGHARYGIKLFNNFKDFKTFLLTDGIKELRGETGYKKRTNSNNKFVYVLSEYVTNQLLIKKYVFNFRVMFLVSLVNNKYRGYFVMPIVLHLAKKERENNLNPDDAISTSGIPELNLYQDNIDYDDLTQHFGEENTLNMINQIKYVLSKLLKLIKKKKILENYEKVHNTYEIFGLDFISDDNFNIKLIEFNDQVGLNERYPSIIFQTLASCIVHSTINKLYDKQYHLPIDKTVRKNIIRIHTRI